MNTLAPQAYRMILAAAGNLTHLARLYGALPTLETEPRQPLAMGNHFLRLTLRPVRQPEPAAADNCRRPDLLEKLAYHEGARQDMSLEDCLSFLANGWTETPGRTYTQLVLQITELLAAAPFRAYCNDDCRAYTQGTEAELQALRKKVATYEARDALGLVPQPAGELGPDGKEWAKTAAAYQHVEAMVPRADGQGRGPFWYGWALRGAFVAGAEWQEARRQSAPQATHPDDAAVDRFAAAMKDKLASARAKGRSGWEDKEQCNQDSLALDLRRHVNKGDPVDVGNFAMMLHQRGESTKLRPLSQDLVDAIKNAPPGASVIEHNGHPVFITRATEEGAPLLGVLESNHSELQAKVLGVGRVMGEILVKVVDGGMVPKDLQPGMVVDVLYTPASEEAPDVRVR